MKTINVIGKKLSREEQREIAGGKYRGCAVWGQQGWAYAEGCCLGLVACGSKGECIGPNQCLSLIE